MMRDFGHLDGLHVKVDDILYMPSLQSPVDKPHPFIYFLSIINDSDEEVQIYGRKWLLEEAHETLVLEGDGVIGEMPIIMPDEKFSYNSYHVTATSAEAQGAFYAKTASGMHIMVEIPMFQLELP